MLGYTTQNACLPRMNIIVMTDGLIHEIDDILTCIKFLRFALGSEQYLHTLANFHRQKNCYAPHMAIALFLRTWI
jgi:hypothetical protein